MPTTDDTSRRTELPTPLRLREARQRGEVARSTDLSAAAATIGSLVVLAVAGGWVIHALRTMLWSSLATLSEPRASVTAPIVAALPAVATVCVAGLIVSILATLAQIGPLMTGQPLKVSLSRLRPGRGLRQMVGARAGMRLVFAVAKVAVTGLICRHGLVGGLGDLRVGSAEATAAAGGWLIVSVGLQAAAALSVLGVLDLLYQRWQFRRDHRMTRREYLDDLRKMEGDPQIRRRRRREMTARREQRREGGQVN